MKKILIVIIGAVLAVGAGISLSALKGPPPPPTVVVEAPQSISDSTGDGEDTSTKIIPGNPAANEMGDTIFSTWVGILVIAIIVAAGFLYFLPTIYAYRTKHPKRDVVLLINLLAGWTFAGWIAAMIFAAIKQAPSLEEELETLEKLQTTGKISYDEFLAKRARLLS